jgi:hypothetical protein
MNIRELNQAHGNHLYNEIQINAQPQIHCQSPMTLQQKTKNYPSQKKRTTKKKVP